MLLPDSDNHVPLLKARTAKSPMIDLSDVPSVNMASALAGNGMHVAQAGAIVILAALFIEPL